MRPTVALRFWSRRICLLPLFLFSIAVHADMWCTAYYPGWEQQGNVMPASAIDFTAVTHIIHFSVVPKPDASLDTVSNSLTPGNSANIVTNAHNAGRKVLFCVGGANSQAGFQGATSTANLSAFISNLVSFMTTRGYDGMDIDWEPLPSTDTTQYTNLVNGLRTALNGINPRPLLTAAIATPPTPVTLIAALQNQFDQINLMTYDLSGPYPGWVTWFNAPIFDGGYRFASTGGLVPSADGMVKSCVNAGVARGKLAIGIAFYGYVWQGGSGTTTGGVTQPRQAWTNPPVFNPSRGVSYNNIMATYYQPQLYHYDTAAQCPYLSITNANPANDQFISYDDQRTCQAKVSYARNSGLGGVMIWELAQDHYAGQTDPLLQSIKQAMATPGATTLRPNGQNIELNFSGIPLGSYRVQWKSNLTAGVWNTLTITNVPNTGTGGVIQVTDPDATAGPAPRFYRIQTPP
jgi:chitinase